MRHASKTGLKETLSRKVPQLAAAIAALVYLSYPSARYNFDGIACAIAVDLSDFRHLVHGNHLTYGILVWLWFELWRLLGYSGASLPAIQVMSSLLGAAGVGIFVRLLLRCGIRPALAMTAAAGLMVSQVYWTWSLEAQV